MTAAGSATGLGKFLEKNMSFRKKIRFFSKSLQKDMRLEKYHFGDKSHWTCNRFLSLKRFNSCVLIIQLKAIWK